jgi:hypothetical protein
MYCSVLLFYLLLIDLAERDDIKKMVHALENLFLPHMTADIHTSRTKGCSLDFKKSIEIFKKKSDMISVEPRARLTLFFKRLTP